MRKTIFGAAVLFGGLLQSSIASTISNGSFSFTGTLFVTKFSTSAVVTPAGTCPASATGMACIFFQDSNGSTNNEVDISTSGLPNGDIPLSLAGTNAANVSPLHTPPEVVGSAGFPAQLFMSFNNGGVTTQLDINQIEPGIYSSSACLSAPLSGQQCTLPGSLFNFVNNPPPSPAGTPCNGECQATASWAFDGVTSGNPGTQSSWVGNFTSQFPVGTPYQSVFAELQAKGYVSNTFSGTITLIPPVTTFTPEPGSMVLMIGAGMIGLSFLWRRRSSRAAK